MKASKQDKDQQLMWESYAKTQQANESGAIVSGLKAAGTALKKGAQRFAGAAKTGGAVRAGEKVSTSTGKIVRQVGDRFEVLVKGGGRVAFDSAEGAAKWVGANPGQILKYGAGGAAIYGGYKTLDSARQNFLGMSPAEKAAFIKANPELGPKLIKQTGVLDILKDPETGAYSPGRVAAAGAAGIGAKLAYDYLKPKKKKDDED